MDLVNSLNRILLKAGIKNYSSLQRRKNTRFYDNPRMFQPEVDWLKDSKEIIRNWFDEDIEIFRYKYN